MNTYEQNQIKAIERWKREEPGIVAEAFDFLTAPWTWVLMRLIPVGLLQGALDGANAVARKTADTQDIKRYGRVASIDELRTKSLYLSDQLANRVHSGAVAVGGAGGAALGATGVGGVALDVSSLITLSLRTIHKIGLCYGYTNLNKQLVLGILSIASAANRKEKINSIARMHDIERMIVEEGWEGLAKDALLARVARGGAFFTARDTSKRLGRNLVQRKSLQLVPMVGAVLGLVTNVAFLTDVSWAARHVFQEKWLIDNGRFPERVHDKKKPATQEKDQASASAS